VLQSFTSKVFLFSETRHWTDFVGYDLQPVGCDGEGIFWFTAKWNFGRFTCKYSK